VTEQLGGKDLRFQVPALCALEEAAVLYSEGILENSNHHMPDRYRNAVCKNRILTRKKRVQHTKEQRTVKKGKKLQTINFCRLVKEIVTEQLGGKDLRFQVPALCALEEAAVLYSEGILENSNHHMPDQNVSGRETP